MGRCVARIYIQELFEVLETDDWIIIESAHSRKALDAFEEYSKLLALVGFIPNVVQELGLPMLEVGSLTGELIELDSGDGRKRL